MKLSKLFYRERARFKSIITVFSNSNGEKLKLATL